MAKQVSLTKNDEGNHLNLLQGTHEDRRVANQLQVTDGSAVKSSTTDSTSIMYVQGGFQNNSRKSAGIMFAHPKLPFELVSLGT
jgi:hypothetical protein